MVVNREAHAGEENEYSTYALKVAEVFQGLGYNVEVLKASEYPDRIVPRKSNRLECGDGRTANVPNAEESYALFGGYWFYPSLVSGGTYPGLTDADVKYQLLNVNGVVHGSFHDGHEDPLACGLFGLWKSGQLNAGTDFHLGKDLLTVLQGRGIPMVSYPGEHEENRIVMSAVPGFAPVLDKTSFRLTADLAKDLDVTAQLFASSSADAVNQLTHNSVKHVQIYV